MSRQFILGFWELEMPFFVVPTSSHPRSQQKITEHSRRKSQIGADILYIAFHPVSLLLWSQSFFWRSGSDAGL